MDDFYEQEFFYVATVRPDGGQPHLGKAMRDRIFTDAEAAGMSRDLCQLSYPGCRFAVYRAVARIPTKPKVVER